MGDQTHIELTSYTNAFLSWGDTVCDDEQNETIKKGCEYLLSKFQGVVAINKLCDAAVVWLRQENPVLGRIHRIEKSNLLWRLIYAGERLRIHPCPIHLGHWSGWLREHCPAGCTLGINTTGWLPPDRPPKFALWPKDLLAGVLANPTDDAPRLVLADWLNERGDPRGELIQVQCSLAANQRPNPHLEERQRALLERHGQAWLGELGFRTAEFTRGFVEEVELPWNELVARLPALSQATPLRALHVKDRPTHAAIDAIVRYVPNLETLDLTGSEALTDAHETKLTALSNLHNRAP